jgi:hypothetical protein
MKSLIRVLPILLLFHFSLNCLAQAPKFVLLEEFTGMNCGPCAAQNPGFLANILTPNPVVVHHIAYHPSWPGSDIMYNYNKPPVDSMVYQYLVTGVPNVEMLGNQKNASPSGIKQSDIDGEFSSGSPIKVLVTDVVVSGNNHQATVVISSVSPPPSGTYRLRTIVSEYLHYATPPGGNGEKDFPNVFRKMMPSWKGDHIVLPSVGNSVTFTYNYVADTLWKQANIKVTSYVQNTLTNEVLNCGSTGDPAINYSLGLPSVIVQHGAASAVSSFNLTSMNTGSVSEQFSYTLSSNAPSGWSANFTVGGSTYPTTATITTPAGTTNNIVIHVTPDATPFVATYSMKVQSVTNPSFPPMISKVYVISNVSDLIVNNSGYIGDGVTAGSAANWDSVYTTGLAYANRLTVGKTDEKVMTAAISQGAFAGVKNVYLNVGWTFPALTDPEVAQLTGFLNGGGNMFISGSDVAWDTWGPSPATGTYYTRAFFSTYLNSTFINDSCGATALKPVSTDTIFGALPTPTITRFYGPSSDYPDVIQPAGIGVPIYTFSTSGKVAGVRANNLTFKVVFLSVGVEELASPLDRRIIIKTAHDWFYGLHSLAPTGIQEMGSPGKMLGQNYPNPANTITNIPLENVQKQLTLEVTDLTGRIIQSQEVPPGIRLISVSTAGLSPGIYFYRLMDGQNQLGCRPMEVNR